MKRAAEITKSRNSREYQQTPEGGDLSPKPQEGRRAEMPPLGFLALASRIVRESAPCFITLFVVVFCGNPRKLTGGPLFTLSLMTFLFTMKRFRILILN